MATEGWTIVSRHGAKAKHRYSARDPHRASSRINRASSSISQAEEKGAPLISSLVDRALGKVRSSEFYGNFRLQMQKPDSFLSASLLKQHQSWEIVVYGLGSISESEVSRCQLALALLLKEELPSVSRILVYDPVLSPSECRSLREFGCFPIEVNERGLRKVVRPTLFYMPHCEAELYDNVLQANWKCLNSVGILGNSFRSYRDRWSVHPKPSSNYPVHLLGIQPRAQEHHIDAMEFPSISAFNDMSWHFFPAESESSAAAQLA